MTGVYVSVGRLHGDDSEVYPKFHSRCPVLRRCMQMLCAVTRCAALKYCSKQCIEKDGEKGIPRYTLSLAYRGGTTGRPRDPMLSTYLTSLGINSKGTPATDKHLNSFCTYSGLKCSNQSQTSNSQVPHIDNLASVAYCIY